MYTLSTTNFSETHYEPYITTSSYNSLQSGCVIGKNEFYNLFFYFLFENYYSCFYWLDNSLSTDQSLSETLIKIQKELVANTFILNRLLSKVEVLESNSKNNNTWNSSTTNHYIDSNFLLLFTMKTKEEFLSIEDKIVHEVDFVSKLVPTCFAHELYNTFIRLNSYF